MMTSFGRDRIEREFQLKVRSFIHEAIIINIAFLCAVGFTIAVFSDFDVTCIFLGIKALNVSVIWALFYNIASCLSFIVAERSHDGKLRDLCMCLGSGCLASLVMTCFILPGQNEMVMGVVSHVVVTICLAGVKLSHMHTMKHLPVYIARRNLHMQMVG